MRRLLVSAGLLLIIGSTCVLAARGVLDDDRDQWMAANWLFAAGLLLTIPGLCLRHASRGEASLWARSWSTAAHTVFFTGCVLGLTLAALRFGFGGIGDTEIDWGLLRLVRSTNDAFLVGVVVAFGLGFVLDAVFLWSDDGFGPAAAVLSIVAGLGLIGLAVIDGGNAPGPLFALLVVLGLSMLMRALDGSSTGAITAPERRPPPGGTPR
jgi:hypothetical protein